MIGDEVSITHVLQFEQHKTLCNTFHFTCLIENALSRKFGNSLNIFTNTFSFLCGCHQTVCTYLNLEEHSQKFTSLKNHCSIRKALSARKIYIAYVETFKSANALEEFISIAETSQNESQLIQIFEVLLFLCNINSCSEVTKIFCLFLNKKQNIFSTVVGDFLKSFESNDIVKISVIESFVLPILRGLNFADDDVFERENLQPIECYLYQCFEFFEYQNIFLGYALLALCVKEYSVFGTYVSNLYFSADLLRTLESYSLYKIIWILNQNYHLEKLLQEENDLETCLQPYCSNPGGLELNTNFLKFEGAFKAIEFLETKNVVSLRIENMFFVSKSFWGKLSSIMKRQKTLKHVSADLRYSKKWETTFIQMLPQNIESLQLNYDSNDQKLCEALKFFLQNSNLQILSLRNSAPLKEIEKTHLSPILSIQTFRCLKLRQFKIQAADFEYFLGLFTKEMQYYKEITFDEIVISSAEFTLGHLTFNFKSKYCFFKGYETPDVPVEPLLNFISKIQTFCCKLEIPWMRLNEREVEKIYKLVSKMPNLTTLHINQFIKQNPTSMRSILRILRIPKSKLLNFKY